MPVKVILLDNYEQLDYLGSNDILKSYNKNYTCVLESFWYHLSA